MSWRWITLLCGWLITTVAHAQILPVNVIVVVNADSSDSRAIAKQYVSLRNVPTENVIELSDVPDGLKTSLDEFQDKILMPVLKEIDSRGLAPTARVIAYSAGFPTAVDISRHTARLEDETLKKYQKPTASLTGLTYLYYFLLADSPHYLSWGANLYARGQFQRHFINPFVQQPAKSTFEQASTELTEKRFAEAADRFEQLFEEHPLMSPLAILAAESRMGHGDREAASLLIHQAVAAGWSSSKYLRQHESLGPLMQDDSLAALSKRMSDRPISVQEPVRFSSLVGWANNGHPYARPDQGVRYLMSCMLAVLHPRGSEVQQATDVLRRAATADRTHPRGKFWFTRTKDIRTTTRFPAVGDAIEWLRYHGHDADIVHAVMPSSNDQCVGLMLGTASTPLDGRNWKFAPGAISENLTSLSAAFNSRSQSKITELLHCGAALSGGAVAEPYSIPAKFPSPMLYGYYASGVTGIEAFYLSITSPYQYLIVGDPLVQPFGQ